jgi:hypothetical protein
MRRFGENRPGRGGPLQVFTYGPLEFNVNRALVLAGNRARYRPERCRPDPSWIGPFIDIDPAYVDRCDSSKPILFATLTLPGHPRELLIDGNHRAAHALKYGKDVRVIVLDLPDTLRVLAGPAELIAEIKEEGRRLSLLPQEPEAGGTRPG